MKLTQTISGIYLTLIILLANSNSSAQENGYTFIDAPFENGVLIDGAFIDDQNGFAVGHDDSTKMAVIIATTNGGDSWEMHATPFEGIFNAIYFVNADTGYAVGQEWDPTGAIIIKTTDGGQTWNRCTIPQFLGSLRDITFTSPTSGWAVGADFDKGETVILNTLDGDTWIFSDHPVVDGGLSSVSFVDENKGWIAGTDDVNETPRLLYTDNGGLNWTEQLHPVEKGVFTQVTFQDDQTGWVSGRTDTMAVLLNTVDGGITWDVQWTPDISEYVNTSRNVIEKGAGSQYYKLSTFLVLGLIIVSCILVWFGAEALAGIFFSENAGSVWTPFFTTFIIAAIYALVLVTGKIVTAGKARVPISFNDVKSIIGFGDQDSKPLIIKFDTPTTHIEESDNQLPKNFHLFQNHPNPFNPETTIRFSLSEASHVILKIYDLKGRTIAELVNSQYQPGTYSVPFNGQQLPSGIYVYSIQTRDNRAVRKMVLLE